jgi:hypothetical protein
MTRAATTLGAAVMAIVEGTLLSPRIDALHRSGAIRGFGEAGLELERWHRLAETTAKLELVLGLASLVLVVIRSRRANGAEESRGMHIA